MRPLPKAPAAGRPGSCWSGEMCGDMSALTPNKEERHYGKLIALVGEREAEEEISEEPVVAANSR